MKVLLIEDNPALRELIEFTLESQLSTTTEWVPFVKDAALLLDKGIHFDAILCAYYSQEEDALKLLKKIKAISPEPTLLIYGNEAPEETSLLAKDDHVFFIAQNDLFKGLHVEIQKIRKRNRLELPEQEFCRVRSSIALRFGLLKCDLYVKTSDHKYIKVMREGDLFDLLDMNRFETKKVDFFYILNQDAHKVMGRLGEEFEKFTSNENQGFDSQIQVSTTLLEMISDFSHSCGFTSEVQSLTKKSVRLSIRAIQKSPKLQDLYTQISVYPERYLVSHSVLLAHVACGMASLMGWTSESTFFKLSLAAFLHDMELDQDALSKLQNLSELEAHGSEFSEEEKTRFRNHPEACSDLILTLDEVPSDIHLIVREHHEFPDGSGFPRGMNHTKISPLSAVFIVAENLIHFQTQICMSPDISIYLENLPPAFSKGQFREITQALVRSVKTHEV